MLAFDVLMGLSLGVYGIVAWRRTRDVAARIRAVLGHRARTAPHDQARAPGALPSRWYAQHSG